MNIWSCDAKVPAELYAIYDPLGNAAHTALSFDLVGEDVLITGAGPIGAMAVMMAQKAGARYVVVTDINDIASASPKRWARRPSSTSESKSLKT